MKVLSSLVVVMACAGPGQARLAETPTANSKANTGLAPPASQSDRDRSEVVNSMDSMDATQRAQREAEHSAKQAPPPPLPGQPAPPKKPGATKATDGTTEPPPAP